MALSQGCHTPACLVSSESGMFSGTCLGDILCATWRALHWPDSVAEHEASRRWDVTPPFLWDGSSICSINVILQHPSTKHTIAFTVIYWLVCHRLSFLRFNNVLTSVLLSGFLFRAPCLCTSSDTAVCARKWEEVQGLNPKGFLS